MPQQRKASAGCAVKQKLAVFAVHLYVFNTSNQVQTEPPMETPKTLTLNQAAKWTGRSKGTISKALKEGRLSYIAKDDTGYSIDPSELNRVFPVNMEKVNTRYQTEPPIEHQENTQTIREMELRLEAAQQETAIYREQLRDKDATIEDYRIRLTKAEDTISRQTVLLADMRQKPPENPAQRSFWPWVRKST